MHISELNGLKVLRVEKRATDAQLTVIFAKIVLPGANHFILWERPGDVAAGIEKWIRLTEVQERRSEQSPLQNIGA